MKLALVKWHDAHSDDSWQDIPDEYETVLVESVGYIVEQDDGVVLIPNLIADSQCFGTVHIPRGCIVEIVCLAHCSECCG